MSGWLETLVPQGPLYEVLLSDAVTNGWTPCSGEPEIHQLIGRARGAFTAVVFVPPLSATTVPLCGYVFKRPHRRSEPEASLRASRLEIGPRVVWADEHTIVEEYFPGRWQVTASMHVGERLAPQFAVKFLAMLHNDVLHALDDLPAHLYIKELAAHVEPRFIDWGLAKLLPPSARHRARLLLETLQVFVHLVARFAGGPRGYNVFKMMLIQDEADGDDLRYLLSAAERELSHQGTVFLGASRRAERWTRFFDLAREEGTYPP